VFDIVAVNVAQYLTDFSGAPPKNKALHLRLLRQAIENSPEELQLILGEVLKLPKRKQEELAELLRDVSLSAIISAAKIVADRLKFLTGLEAILFDAESKKRLKPALFSFRFRGTLIPFRQDGFSIYAESTPSRSGNPPGGGG
jgi:hypothetical protein